MTPFFLFSQEKQEEESPKNAIAFHPLSITWGGFKFDYCRKIKEKQWIVVMPTIYSFQGINSLDWNWHDDDRFGYYVDGSKGFGLEVNYKYYLNSDETFYLLGGLSNSFFRVEYLGYDYIPFCDEDGLSFYRYGEIRGTENFDKLGASVSFGGNSSLESGIYVDFYLGVGYVHSFYNKNKFHSVDNYAYDFRYRGFYPALGFSIGYAW